MEAAGDVGCRCPGPDSSANAVTIGTSGGQTIDGASMYVLFAQNNYVTVVSDGVKWHIIANN